MIESTKIITFTGNRNIRSNEVQSAFTQIAKLYPNSIWRTGMAYGLDMAVAKYAQENNIQFEAHLPFPAYIQTKKWNRTMATLYSEYLRNAIKVFTYAKEFSMGAYQSRNIKMAEGADIVIAFNRNARGGTVNMINHCHTNGISVIDGFNLPTLK